VNKGEPPSEHKLKQLEVARNYAREKYDKRFDNKFDQYVNKAVEKLQVDITKPLVDWLETLSDSEEEPPKKVSKTSKNKDEPTPPEAVVKGTSKETKRVFGTSFYTNSSKKEKEKVSTGNDYSKYF
jgi:hypothetical protein